jgi:hypothetical protein
MDMIQKYGERWRTYKSGLLFIVAEGGTQLFDEAKTLLALESLEDPPSWSGTRWTTARFRN